MKNAIYFDMDGTIANFYGVNGWLNDLISENVRPYAEAQPLFDMVSLAVALNALHEKGFHIGIVSWLSKSGTDDFNMRVTEVKKQWLKKYIPFEFDEIKIVPYGTPKSSVVDFPNGILFDDEKPNRKEWNSANYGAMAFDVNNIMKVLESVRV